MSEIEDLDVRRGGQHATLEYTYQDLDRKHRIDQDGGNSPGDLCRRAGRSFFCKRTPLQLLLKYLPFITLLRDYDIRKNLAPDIVSGLSVSVLHTGQGLGYAALANLPPVYGIYVSLFHSIVYFIFGTSKHISVGTHSLASLLVGTVVAREAGEIAARGVLNVTAATAPGYGNATTPAFAADDIEQIKVGIAATLSFMVGVIMVALGVLRIGGLLANYISPAFIGGFTCASAFHIASSQLKYAAFGRKNHIGGYSGVLKLYYVWRDFFVHFLQINWMCSVCFLSSLALLLAVKMGINKHPRLRHRLLTPVPIDLVVIVGFTLLSYYFDFEGIPDRESGVEVVGRMPVGLPSPTAPTFYKWSAYVGDAFVLSILGYLFNYTMANIFKEKYKYQISENQEMLAAGISHVVASFFGCFPGSASPPRCFMQDATGGKTQLASFVSCVVLVLVLYVIQPYLYYLPFAVIAALVCVSLKRLMLQLRDLRPLWRQDKFDFFVWVVTFLATFIMDIELGMIVGVAFHILAVAARLQLSNVYAVGEVGSIYESVKTYRTAENADCVFLRYNSPILYLNCERFTKAVIKLALKGGRISENTSSPEAKVGGELQPRPPAEQLGVKSIAAKAVIFDCTYAGMVDTAGAKALLKIWATLQDEGMQFYLAGCSPRVRDTLAAVAPKLLESAFLSLREVKAYANLTKLAQAEQDTNL